MNDSILNWLLEDTNPEVKLRTLKEALKLPDTDAKVIECKKQLLQSKTYERALNRLHKTKYFLPNRRYENSSVRCNARNLLHSRSY